jgi:hypothetical protein
VKEGKTPAFSLQAVSAFLDAPDSSQENLPIHSLDGLSEDYIEMENANNNGNDDNDDVAMAGKTAMDKDNMANEGRRNNQGQRNCQGQRNRQRQ